MFSLSLHAAAAAALLWHTAPLFIGSFEAANGAGGKSYKVVYLGRTQRNEGSLNEAATLRLPTRRRTPQETASAPRRTTSAHRAHIADDTRLAGTAFGSAANGYDHDIRPALPEVYPSPDIAKSELPQGLQGDVIVEVTIDERGGIVSMRLLQGLGFGIEDKVLSALRSWHFKPATRDGIAIASRQDVHFHFPS